MSRTAFLAILSTAIVLSSVPADAQGVEEGGAILGPQGTVNPDVSFECEFKADGIAVVTIWAIPAGVGPTDVVVYDSQMKVVLRKRISTKGASYTFGAVLWKPEVQQKYRICTNQLCHFTTN